MRLYRYCNTIALFPVAVGQVDLEFRKILIQNRVSYSEIEYRTSNLNSYSNEVDNGLRSTLFVGV